MDLPFTVQEIPKFKHCNLYRPKTQVHPKWSNTLSHESGCHSFRFSASPMSWRSFIQQLHQWLTGCHFPIPSAWRNLFYQLFVCKHTYLIFPAIAFLPSLDISCSTCSYNLHLMLQILVITIIDKSSKFTCHINFIFSRDSHIQFLATIYVCSDKNY